MAAGYELLTPEPNEINLRDIAHYPQVKYERYSNN